LVSYKRRTFEKWIFTEITRDRPRQREYEIQHMLSRVS